MSDQLMSVMTMCFGFLLFMVVVVMHERHILEFQNCSMIDTVYFWIVTFTTVGFGDIHLPLHVEIEHFSELLLFRVFGLSFLAGVIESMQEYVKYRKVILIRDNKKKFKKISQIIVGNSTPIAMTANFLPGRHDGRRDGRCDLSPVPCKDSREKDIVHRLKRVSAANESEDV